jgi:hypothetical protein
MAADELLPKGLGVLGLIEAILDGNPVVTWMRILVGV